MNRFNDDYDFDPDNFDVEEYADQFQDDDFVLDGLNTSILANDEEDEDESE